MKIFLLEIFNRNLRQYKVLIKLLSDKDKTIRKEVKEKIAAMTNKTEEVYHKDNNSIATIKNELDIKLKNKSTVVSLRNRI